MANAFSRSWQITKLSFNVMKADKELFLFPLLAIIFSLIFVVLMIIPSILPAILDHAGFGAVGTVLNYFMIFLIYLGLAFIATFFNVCVVYTVKTRFEGGNATLGSSMKFAFSKIHLIFAWSLLSATVGLFLRFLDNLAQRFGRIGKLLMAILTSILGMVWSIMTIFVVPVMVYKGVGPIDAIKLSLQTLKKTWGESLIRYFALGFAQFVLIFVGVGIFILLIVLTAGNLVMLLVLLGLMIIYIVGVSLLFSIANTIFNTALFVYADTGQIPMGFTQEVMQQAFRPNKPSLFGGRQPQQPMQQPQQQYQQQNQPQQPYQQPQQNNQQNQPQQQQNQFQN